MVLEVRIYKIEPGKRDAFVELYDSELLPAQRELGLDVLGQFVSVEDDETFVWLRRFENEEERQLGWERFYGSDLWKNDLGPRANALMVESDNVLLVTPTPGSAIQ